MTVMLIVMVVGMIGSLLLAGHLDRQAAAERERHVSRRTIRRLEAAGLIPRHEDRS